ncbi:collectin-10 isoform X7 [Odocoileus virginianus]|uniref:Collectin-10 isoform X7 n=1 Tax=Odocoileus virginianus TaxID=9874 RepID=A0ABM4IZS6_ODOVR
MVEVEKLHYERKLNLGRKRIRSPGSQDLDQGRLRGDGNTQRNHTCRIRRTRRRARELLQRIYLISAWKKSDLMENYYSTRLHPSTAFRTCFTDEKMKTRASSSGHIPRLWRYSKKVDSHSFLLLNREHEHDHGDDGEKGDPGEEGKLGKVGRMGPKGVKGELGDAGDQGNIGKTGPIGKKGDKGEKGLPGIPGGKGKAGTVCDCGRYRKVVGQLDISVARLKASMKFVKNG